MDQHTPPGYERYKDSEKSAPRLRRKLPAPLPGFRASAAKAPTTLEKPYAGDITDAAAWLDDHSSPGNQSETSPAGAEECPAKASTPAAAAAEATSTAASEAAMGDNGQMQTETKIREEKTEEEDEELPQPLRGDVR